MKIEGIDSNKEFDFGRVSLNYAKYRDIYPESLYAKLIQFGIGLVNQHILDVGSGTGVLPRNMAFTNAKFTASDISNDLIREGEKIAADYGIHNIEFRVCSAENTGLSNNSYDVITAVQCFHYFNTSIVIPEFFRLLKPEGKICKIFMDWLPFEDEVVAEMEELVLQFNPDWSGGGFKRFEYNYPEWLNERFELETIHSYNEYLNFTKEAWIGRVLTCRGVGASLTSEKVKEFKNIYMAKLHKYSGQNLKIKHQIHIEIYRKI